MFSAVFIRSEYGIDMEVTMTNSDDSKVVIWIDSSETNPYYGPDLAYGCDYNGVSSDHFRRISILIIEFRRCNVIITEWYEKTKQ